MKVTNNGVRDSLTTGELGRSKIPLIIYEVKIKANLIQKSVYTRITDVLELENT